MQHKGKKTLNIEHILDALKAMNYNNHIKALMKELLELEKNWVSEEKYEDHSNENHNEEDIFKSDSNSNEIDFEH